eukprot:5017486-Pleurochrysis_carterae.AAC.1
MVKTLRAVCPGLHPTCGYSCPERNPLLQRQQKLVSSASSGQAPRLQLLTTRIALATPSKAEAEKHR